MDPGSPDEDPRLTEARPRLSAIQPMGPFWITRVERLSGEGELVTHKVYFEDAEGLDHHFFPYGDPVKHEEMTPDDSAAEMIVVLTKGGGEVIWR
jgi:hypothetical protein